MKYSIILLIYNSPLESILMTLKSIIMQKFEDFEIIIADDGSKKKYLTEIENYMVQNKFDKFCFAPSEKNVGTVKNILRALKLANGKYIKCIGAGDLLKNKDVLQYVYDEMSEKGAKWAFGEMSGYCIENGKVKNRNFFAPLEKYPYKRNQLSTIRKKIIVCQEHISGAAMFFEKDYFVKYLKEIENCVIYTEDIVQVLIMIKDPNILYLKNKVVLYEVGSGISTAQKGFTVVDKDIEQFDRYIEKTYHDELIEKRLYRERVLKEANRLYKYLYLLLEAPIRVVLEQYAKHTFFTPKEQLGYLNDESFLNEFGLIREKK
mgnify:CR=1 FL=1